MGKLSVKVEDGQLKFGVDANEDGQNSLTVKLHLSEMVQEMISRGGAVDGAKVVDFKFSGTKLTLKIDTDRDGEPLLELELDLAESFDEVASAVTKKS